MDYGERQQVGLSEPMVVDIVVSSGHDYWVRKGEPTMQHGAQLIRRAELVAGRGIRGDRYFAKPPHHKGQVTLIALDAIEEIRRAFDLPELPVTVFRRNLVVRDLNLAGCVGKRFHLHGVELEGVQECTPCRWMDRMVADGALAFMKQCFRGGLRARVLSDGVIECDGVSREHDRSRVGPD